HAALDLDQVYADLRLLSAGYSDVELPVVVIGGVQDRIAPFGESVAFHRHLANARLIAVDDGGHALHVTHPSEVLKAIDLAVAMATRPALRPRLAATSAEPDRRPTHAAPLDERTSLAAGEAVA
ncbi:MAG TPA: alpha/beta hydrolase, partial [Thermoleophilia bacterium]|nr:alpha/beta hydrolase [Thermoleophilia bacterium]